jgi:hypothetical protein
MCPRSFRCCCRCAQQDPHATIYTCVLITFAGAVAGAVADALKNITPDEFFGDQVLTSQKGYTEGVTEEEEGVGQAADKIAAAERVKGGAKLEEGGMPTFASGTRRARCEVPKGQKKQAQSLVDPG